MAAKGEQIPAFIDASESAPDHPDGGASTVDGDVGREPTAATVRARLEAVEEFPPGADPREDFPSPVVLQQEDGEARDGERENEESEEAVVAKVKEEEEEEDAEEADRGGGCDSAGGKRTEKKGALYLPDAKRRKTCPTALENSPTQPPAGGSAAVEEADGAERDGESLARSFSFSFDTRGFAAAPIETTPKFGSFNFATVSSDGPAAETGGGVDEVRGLGTDGGEL